MSTVTIENPSSVREKIERYLDLGYWVIVQELKPGHYEYIEKHRFEGPGQRRVDWLNGDHEEGYEMLAPNGFTDWSDAKEYAKQHKVALVSAHDEEGSLWYPLPPKEKY
jgi:hypothetical protein